MLPSNELDTNHWERLRGVIGIGSRLCSALQTPPRDDVFALRYHFSSIRM